MMNMMNRRRYLDLGVLNFALGRSMSSCDVFTYLITD